jgi:Spy/CpxP family protein refolding chaperone
MRMEMGQCMIDELDLTEAQVAQIKAIRERYRDADKDRVKAMRELRKDMREARRGGDQAEFERLRTQMQQAAEQLRASREQMHTEVMNVLTAEQRAKFDAAREKCHEQGKKGRKGGRHGKGHCDGEGDGGQRMRGPANTGERQNPNID